MAHDSPLPVLPSSPSRLLTNTLTSVSSYCVQEEGLSLAKRNSELKATAHRLKAAARSSEAEHQRVLSRMQQLEAELAREQGRYSQASQAAGEQVLQLHFKALCMNLLALIKAVTAIWKDTGPCCHKVMCMYCSGSGLYVALLLEFSHSVFVTITLLI